MSSSPFTSDRQAPTHALRSLGVGREPGHMVQFYEDERFLAGAVADFLAAGLEAGQTVLVVATAAHRGAFTAELFTRGADVAGAEHRRQLRWLDAHETLAEVLVDGMPDARRFRRVVGRAVAESRHGDPQAVVRVYGEMVDLLWADGHHDAATRLEALWNELADTQAFSLLCAYALAGFADASHEPAFRAVCGHHGQVFPTERYTHGDDAARLLEVSLLQQRARALETELARRTALEAELRRSEQDLRDMLENAAEAIHWVGPDGTILWANAAELEMLGYTREEYVGRPITEFHADAEGIADILACLVRGETLRDREARLLARDGSIHEVLINSNVLWRDGEFVHTRCFTRDVTARNRAAAEHERLLEGERAARAEAEAANRAKSEFLAVMSHELRTPLNAIGGYTELIEMGVRGPVTEAQREDLARIQKSQRHLLGLINEVLNYTRIESGAVRYVVEDVRLADVIASAEPLVRPQLMARGIAFVVEPLASRVVARADEEKVRQVLLNLLSNAIKFTERGGRVTVACDATDDAAFLRVRDTGIGIPAEKLATVFEPFVQVHTGFTRVHEGTGLGLAISRDLARGMGGDLTVESEVGVGSCFTLELPNSD